jgi:hypothetical protein
MMVNQGYVQTPNSQQFLFQERLPPLVMVAVMMAMAQGQMALAATVPAEVQIVLNLSYHQYSCYLPEGYYPSRVPLQRQVKHR